MITREGLIATADHAGSALADASSSSFLATADPTSPTFRVAQGMRFRSQTSEKLLCQNSDRPTIDIPSASMACSKSSHTAKSGPAGHCECSADVFLR